MKASDESLPVSQGGLVSDRNPYEFELFVPRIITFFKLLCNGHDSDNLNEFDAQHKFWSRSMVPACLPFKTFTGPMEAAPTSADSVINSTSRGLHWKHDDAKGLFFFWHPLLISPTSPCLLFDWSLDNVIAFCELVGWLGGYPTWSNLAPKRYLHRWIKSLAAIACHWCSYGVNLAFYRSTQTLVMGINGRPKPSLVAEISIDERIVRLWRSRPFLIFPAVNSIFMNTRPAF